MTTDQDTNMAKTDYRAQAYAWAGPGNEIHVDVIASRLHYNESLHLHELGNEQYGACTYCWLRAGRAVRALVDAGALATTKAAQ
jgi:hypothetical protein